MSKALFDNPSNKKRLMVLIERGIKPELIAREFGCHTYVIKYHIRTMHIDKEVRGSRTPKPKKEGYCPTCEMLLTSKYHQEFPCT